MAPKTRKIMKQTSVDESPAHLRDLAEIAPFKRHGSEMKPKKQQKVL